MYSIFVANSDQLFLPPLSQVFINSGMNIFIAVPKSLPITEFAIYCRINLQNLIYMCKSKRFYQKLILANYYHSDNMIPFKII